MTSVVLLHNIEFSFVNISQVIGWGGWVLLTGKHVECDVIPSLLMPGWMIWYYWWLPARRYASAGNSDRSVSVHPSVTRRYCVKTKKASVMVSSPSGSPKTLVFWRQISSPNSKGFPSNGGLKQGSVGKIQRFSSFKLQYLENGSRYDQSYY